MEKGHSTLASVQFHFPPIKTMFVATTCEGGQGIEWSALGKLTL